MKHLVFKRGLRDGIPIGLGYFVVSIGIGIACRTAKLGAAQGFFMSLLNNASAGSTAASRSSPGTQASSP